MSLVVATWFPGDEPPPDHAADVLEVRLDAIDPERIPEAIAAADRPVLAACRRRADGGARGMGEDERRDRLVQAIEAGADLVDVEHDAPFREDLAPEIRQQGAHLVVSEHLDHTPSVEAIVDRLRELARAGDVAKLATTAERERDAHTLLAAGLEAPTIGTPFALMGVDESLTRALAGPLDQALVYAAPDEDPVPGQLPTELQARLPRRSPTPEPREDHVLIGHPVGHSLSPPMQEAGFAALGREARYRLIDAAPDELATVLEGLTVTTNGGNVTAPHKLDLYELADEATEEARKVGAANTFRFDEGRLYVHMTDGLGARDALTDAGVDLEARRVLVLGAGGTARALAHAFADAGADVHLANRTREKAKRVADDVGGTVHPLEEDALAQVVTPGTVVVNATPVDPPVPDEALGEAVAFDANYGHRADFAARATRAGARTFDGLDLLVAQGVRSLSFWTGEEIPASVEARMSTAARTRALERRYRRDRA